MKIELQPRIEFLVEKKLIGKHLKMTFSHNKTGQLWASFMPRRKEIDNTISSDFIAMQLYPKDLNLGNPNQEFEKWAAVEVSNFNKIPSEMDSFILSGGQYAVFDYKGSSADTRIFTYIFQEWLPKSEYNLDDRPHFEVLGEKYKNNDTNSEEEIWIPICQK